MSEVLIDLIRETQKLWLWMSINSTVTVIVTVSMSWNIYVLRRGISALSKRLSDLERK